MRPWSSPRPRRALQRRAQRGRKKRRDLQAQLRQARAHVLDKRAVRLNKRYSGPEHLAAGVERGHGAPGVVLVAHAGYGFRVGAYVHDAVLAAETRKVGVLGKKAVAGMYGLRARNESGAYNVLLI